MNEIKYEPLYGLQKPFDNGPADSTAYGLFRDGDEYIYYKIDKTSVYCFDTDNQWSHIDGAPTIPFLAMRRIIKEPVQHSDDAAVDLFAAKMKEKLKKSRDKGRRGWESCPIEHLITSLKDHISKGDPVDVANFAMMISQRGESIKTPVWTVEDQKAGRLPEVGSLVMVEEVDECASVAAINNDAVCVVFYDGEFTTLHKSGISPIETPEEKADRLRSEWVSNAHKQYFSDENTERNQFCYIYDALLSGELPVPTKGGK